MLFRAILSCAALIMALLLCLNANAEPAERPSKPLDIMKFMREQAASTRATEKPKRAIAQPAASAPKRAPVAATPTAVPSEAASSFAAQPAPAPEVELVAEDELNAIDRAGEAAPPETVGAAPQMQMADAGVSTIVTKGQQRAPAMEAPPSQPAPSNAPQLSWWQWLWSAVRDSLAALVAAVHALIG